MKNEDRIVELLAELVQKQDVFADRLETMSGKLDSVVAELQQTNHQLEKLEDKVDTGLAKVNAGLNEVRLSVMRLADKLDKQDEIEKRLTVIEKIVLK